MRTCGNPEGTDRPAAQGSRTAGGSPGLTVIRVGADPAEWDGLSDWLGLFAAGRPCSAVLVPGGGNFLTAVREVQDCWRVGEEVAHRMTLLAMEQHGLMLHGLCPSLHLADSLDGVLAGLRAGFPVVWLPSRMAALRTGLAGDWSMGPDSLSAWLAAELGAARLLLTGSGDAGGGPADALALARDGLVDMAFPLWRRRFGGELWRLHQDDVALMAALIAGHDHHKRT